MTVIRESSQKIKRLWGQGLSLVSAACVVAACSGHWWSDDKDIRGGRGCPQVAILRPLAQVPPETAVKSDRTAPVVRMLGVQVEPCRYDEDQLDVAFILAASIGQSATPADHSVNLPYFVSVVGPDGRIISKEMYAMKLHVSSSDAMQDHEENLRVRLPIGQDKDGALYRILMGFQLDEKYLKSKSESPEMPPGRR